MISRLPVIRRINSTGQIVAQGALPGSSYQALLLTPVQITTLSPAKPPTTAFNLTIKGTGFESGAEVLWNGVALNIVSATSTKIVAQVTAAEAAATGSINVLVLNPDTSVGIKLY